MNKDLKDQPGPNPSLRALAGSVGRCPTESEGGRSNPFPFHIHGAAGTWPFPTKYTSQIREWKDRAQAPSSSLNYTWLLGNKRQQKRACGPGSQVSQMKRTERERDKVSSSLWWKLAVLQPGSWGFSNSGNGGKQAWQPVGSNKMPDSVKEAGLVLNDNHLLRSPVEPGGWAMIHRQATPGPPGWVTEQPVLLCLDTDGSFPSSFLFWQHGNYIMDEVY